MLLEALEVSLGILERLLIRSKRPPTEPKIKIIPISNPGSIECSEAISLYKARFRAAVSATEKDMLRWILDDQRHRRNPLWPRDPLFASIYNGKVCGLIDFTYYPTSRLAFISYLAAIRPQSGLGKAISLSLVGAARSFLERRLVRCKGIVVEVDSPFETTDNKERSERIARLKRFNELAEINGMILVKLNIDYIAPKPHLEEGARESKMLLLYSSLRRKPARNYISYREAKHILSFVFGKLYAESFMYDPKMDHEYRGYINSLLELQLKRIRRSAIVPVVSLKSLISELDKTRLHPKSINTIKRSLTNESLPFYSCFISYSSKDQEFAERLHADLQIKGVKCWFAPEDMKIGDKLRLRIDESIQMHDKLLLIISETAIASQWIEQEVAAALAKEREQSRIVLFPIRLDNKVMGIPTDWPALIRNTRHIGDFTNWKDQDCYQKAFNQLLRDLKSDDKRKASADEILSEENSS